MATKKTTQTKKKTAATKKAIKPLKASAKKQATVKQKSIAKVKKAVKAPVKKKTAKVAVKKAIKAPVKKAAKNKTDKAPVKKKAAVATKKAVATKTAPRKAAKAKVVKKKALPTTHDLSRGKILVTGGAGFIGSALIQALNERGLDNIIVTDFLGQGERFKNLIPLRFDEYLEADDFIELLADDASLFDDVETVFHMGACSATTESDARYLIQNNAAYTQGLAAWALAKGARFVYASSAATYGDGSRGMSDRAPLHTLRPLNMYGYSKHRFDAYAEHHGWLPHIVGLKFFNVFGPNEAHKGDMRSMVAKAFEQIQETGRVRLFESEHPDYADGEQKRDFLYVKDAVAMTLFLAENPKAGGLYNIGSGVASTWNELVQTIFKALGKEPVIEYIPLPEALKHQYQYYTCSENARLLEAGYDKPITPFEEAVTEYVERYLVPGKPLGY